MPRTKDQPSTCSEDEIMYSTSNKNQHHITTIKKISPKLNNDTKTQMCYSTESLTKNKPPTLLQLALEYKNGNTSFLEPNMYTKNMIEIV